jgi:hypothetical protein
MTLKPIVLAVAAAYGRDLFLAPASVQQQQAFLAPAQTAAYGAAAPQYVAYSPTYVAAAEPAGAGSAWAIAAAAAVVGAVVGVSMGPSAQQERDVAALAVEGRETFDRRAVLAAAAAAASIPLVAMADDDFPRDKATEDAVQAIARKNAEKAAAAKAAERAKYQKTDADIEAEQQKSKNLILGIAGAGTVASGAFIVPNLIRLAKKVASGGEDKGYAVSKAKGGRGKAKPPPKQKSFFEKAFSAAFAREEL